MIIFGTLFLITAACAAEYPSSSENDAELERFYSPAMTDQRRFIPPEPIITFTRKSAYPEETTASASSQSGSQFILPAPLADQFREGRRAVADPDARLRGIPPRFMDRNRFSAGEVQIDDRIFRTDSSVRSLDSTDYKNDNNIQRTDRMREIEIPHEPRFFPENGPPRERRPYSDVRSFSRQRLNRARFNPDPESGSDSHEETNFDTRERAPNRGRAAFGSQEAPSDQDMIRSFANRRRDRHQQLRNQFDDTFQQPNQLMLDQSIPKFAMSNSFDPEPGRDPDDSGEERNPLQSSRDDKGPPVDSERFISHRQRQRPPQRSSGREVGELQPRPQPARKKGHGFLEPATPDSEFDSRFRVLTKDEMNMLRKFKQKRGRNTLLVFEPGYGPVSKLRPSLFEASKLSGSSRGIPGIGITNDDSGKEREIPEPGYGPPSNAEETMEKISVLSDNYVER